MFQIHPVIGGTTKWVNRHRLVLDPCQVDESFYNAFPVPSYEMKEDNDSGSDYIDNAKSDSVFQVSKLFIILFGCRESFSRYNI